MRIHKHRQLLLCSLCAIVSSVAAYGQSLQWTLLSRPGAPASVDLHGVAFVDADSGIVCGVRAGAGIAFRTTDRGSTWQRVSLPGSPVGLTDATTIADQRFIAVAGDGGYVAVSHDAGSTWIDRTVSEVAGDIEGIHFTTPRHGVVVGRTSPPNSGPMLLRTTDGGSTWRAMPLTGAANTLYDVAFFDPRFGLAVGTGNPSRKSTTADSGASWEPNATMAVGTASTSMYAVGVVAGTSVAYAVGGKSFPPGIYPEIRRTTDRGASWSLVGYGPSSAIAQIANDVLPLSSRIILVPAASGTMYVSLDSGTTWTQERIGSLSGSPTLRAVSRADNVVYVVGSSGTVLRTSLEPKIDLARSLRLDSVCAGGTAIGTVPVANGGTGLLSIDDIDITQPSDVRVRLSARATRVLPGGSRDSISIVVETAIDAPTGDYRGTAVLHTNAIGNDTLVQIDIAVHVSNRPRLAVAPSDSIDFGPVRVGERMTRTVVLSNVHELACLDSIRIVTTAIGGPNVDDFRLLASLDGLVIPPSTSPDDAVQISIEAFATAIGTRSAAAVIEYRTAGVVDRASLWLVMQGVRPVIRPASATIDFAMTDVDGWRDSVLYDFLANVGDADASITNLRVTGTNATSFIVTAPTGPFTIAAGAKRDIALQFRPTVPGTATAQLEVMIAGENSVVIPLRGTSAYPRILASVTAIDMAPTESGQCRDSSLGGVIRNPSDIPLRLEKVIILADDAGNPLDSLAFTLTAPIVPPRLTIPPHGSIGVWIRFCPTRLGVYRARLAVNCNAGPGGTTVSIPLSGSTPGAIGSIDFPPTRVGRSRDSLLANYVYNSGPGKLRVDSVVLAGLSDPGSFTLQAPATPLDLDAGSGTSMTISFRPARRGIHDATLTVYTSVGKTTTDISGRGIYPRLNLIPSSTGPRAARVGETDQMQVSLLNSGDDTGRVDLLALTGSNAFSMTTPVPTPFTLAPGEEKEFQIDFSPTAPCDHTASLDLRGEGARVVYAMADTSIVLAGRALYFALGERHSEIHFGPRQIGSPNDSTVIDLIANALGTDPTDCLEEVHIDSLVIAGADRSQFSLLDPVDPSLPFTLAPRTGKTVTIRFTPNRSALHTAELRIYHSGTPDSMRVVILNGSGTRLPLSFGSATLDFGNVRLGRDKDSILLLRNLSGADVTIDAIAPPLTNEFTHRTPTVPFTLSAGGSIPVTLRFSPRGSAGQRIAMVLITSGGITDSSFSVMGNGVGLNFRAVTRSIDFGRRAAGSSNDTMAQIDNRTSTTFPLATMLDSVIIERAVIVSGAASFSITTTPASVAANGRDSIGVRFDASGMPGLKVGVMRIYYDPRDSNGIVRDSIDVQLLGTVEGVAAIVGADLGPTQRGRPNDRVRYPIHFSGIFDSLAIDSLELTLSFRRTMLRPIAIHPRQPGVTGSFLDDAVNAARMAIAISLGSQTRLDSGIVADVEFGVLLGDSLETAMHIESIAVPGRPEIGFDRTPSGFQIDGFCDADGRLVIFGTSPFLRATPAARGESLTIEFAIPAVAHTRLSIVDMTGSEVYRAIDGVEDPGGRTLHVAIDALNDGIYFCTIRSGRHMVTAPFRIQR